MNESPSVLGQCLQGLRTPRLLLVGMFDWFDAWYRTRSWAGIFLCSLGFMVTLVCAFGSLASSLQYRDVFSSPFSVKMEEDLPIKELLRIVIQRRAEKLAEQFALQDAFSPESSSQPPLPWGDLASMESEINWKEARFFASCALRLAPSDQRLQLRIALLDDLEGNEGSADTRMKKLAPTSQSGLFPAHTWRLLKGMSVGSTEKLVTWKELEHHLTHALEWDELDPYTLMTISAWLLANDHRSLAEPLLVRAAKMDTQSAKVALQYFQARGMSDEGNSLAEAIAESLSELSRDRVLDRLEDEVLADCLFQLGRDVECLEVLRRLSGSDAMLERTWRAKRVALLVRMQRQAWLKASSNKGLPTEWMEEAAELEPVDPEVGLLIAEGVYRRIPIPAPAQEALKTQITTRIAAPDTHWMLARAFNERGQYASAIQRAQTALEKDSKHAGALEELGVAYLGDSRPESAAAVFLKALQGSVRSPRLHARYGEALLAIGDEETAAENWEASLIADPKQPGLRRKLAELYQRKGLDQKAKVHLVLLGEM